MQTKFMYGSQANRKLLAQAQAQTSMRSGRWQVVRHARKVEEAAAEISQQSSYYMPQVTVRVPIEVHGPRNLELI